MTDETKTFDQVLECAREYGVEDAENALLFVYPGDYSLPQPDLSGQWADGRTPYSLARDCGLSDGDFSFFPNIGEIVGEICDAYEEAFISAIEKSQAE